MMWSSRFIVMLVGCAACTADGKGITYNEHINVAIAVTMPDGGLITPVIKVRGHALPSAT